MSQSNYELAINMGKRMAARRKELQLTQEKVADMANITHQQYNKAENGKTCLRSDSLSRVAVALQISADYLLCGTQSPSKYHDVLEILEKMNEKQLKIAQEVLQCMLAFGESQF